MMPTLIKRRFSMLKQLAAIVLLCCGVTLTASLARAPQGGRGGGGGAAVAQTPPNEMDTHIAIAKTAAGQDYRGTFVNLCLPAGAPGGARGTAPAARGAAGRGGTAGPPQTPDRATWYAPPIKVFDNLYWLGTRQHSSWALQTSAGIILIDTNFAWGTEPGTNEGVTKLRVKRK